MACGKFESTENGMADLFAGGAGAVALRATVATASQKKWGGSILDIKAAFLNAPMVIPEPLEGEERKVKRPIIRPPPILVAAGLVKEDEFWEAEKAVYGYRRSPKTLVQPSRPGDLSVRDGLSDQGKKLYLQQLTTESGLWKVMVKRPDHEHEAQEDFLALVLVYVDDLLVVGAKDVRQTFIDKIRERWETSEPEEVGESEGVRFLGTELWCLPDYEWRMTQINYTLDLLKRNLGPERDLWKGKKLRMNREPEEKEGVEKDAQTVREAQRIVGELVWLSTKTRPDLMLTVARTATQISRDPQQAIAMGKVVWEY